MVFIMWCFSMMLGMCMCLEFPTPQQRCLGKTSDRCFLSVSNNDSKRCLKGVTIVIKKNSSGGLPISPSSTSFLKIRI